MIVQVFPVRNTNSHATKSPSLAAFEHRDSISKQEFLAEHLEHSPVGLSVYLGPSQRLIDLFAYLLHLGTSRMGSCRPFLVFLALLLPTKRILPRAEGFAEQKV